MARQLDIAERTMSLAIIDATAADAESPLSASHSSRYAMPIANSPLIEHVLDELAAGGTTRARVIAHPHVRRDLDRLLGPGPTCGIEVSYPDVPAGDGRAAILSEVERALAAGPVLLHPGDSLFRSQVAAMWERFAAGDVDSVLPEQASVVPLRSPTERRASDTVLLLGPGTRALLEDLRSTKSEGDDLVHSLLASDYRLAVCEQTEHWRYSESTKGLLTANRMMLDALPDTVEREQFGENNQINGRVSISPSAFVSNCVVYGPVSIDDRAVLEDSFVGPYTAIGTDVVLSGVEIDNAMVLAGAEIRQPGSRIESSIIGERSRVTRSFELPRGLHMRLGPDSQITLS
jgi:glucose-1-phosphate thymidylyltransferase